MARAFSYPVMAQEILTVLVNTQVNRVILEGDKCVGVEVLRDGKVMLNKADKEVILSAGGFNMPKILQLSVNGVRNLCIADSTIMPRICAVPTMPAYVPIPFLVRHEKLLNPNAECDHSKEYSSKCNHWQKIKAVRKAITITLKNQPAILAVMANSALTIACYFPTLICNFTSVGLPSAARSKALMLSSKSNVSVIKGLRSTLPEAIKSMARS
jgi:GMC oxidoreductase